jgi:hypothetical protein
MNIRPLYRDCLVCLVIALLCATAVSLLLTWCASLPRIGLAPFPVVCERDNTFGTWVSAFVIVFCLGAMFVVLREIRRWATGDAPGLSLWQAYNAFWRGGRKRATGLEMTQSQKDKGRKT